MFPEPRVVPYNELVGSEHDDSSTFQWSAHNVKPPKDRYPELLEIAGFDLGLFLDNVRELFSDSSVLQG